MPIPTSVRLRPRSVAFAAKWLGVSEQAVRAAIRRGDLDYVDLGDTAEDLHGRHRRVTLAALEDYVRRRSFRYRKEQDDRGERSVPIPVPPSTWLKLEGL